MAKMTADEAIEVIKHVKEGTGKVHIDSVEKATATVNILMALSMGIDALERMDKYRWHDLRENHEDLPETEDSVLVVTKYGNQIFSAYKGWWNPISNKMATDSKQWDLPQYYCSKDIIAWRYIEPFEEAPEVPEQ